MRILIVLVFCAPALASADAIMPLAGECAPGQQVGIRDHAETCIPIDCSSNACPDGSTCTTVCRCMEQRETHNGRTPDPVMRDFMLGLCDASGACAEGRVVEYRECEASPTMEAAVEPPPEMTADMSAPEARTETETRSTNDESGCSVGGGGAALWFALLFVRRRK